MENAATRVLAGLTACAVIWIVVYWSWPQPEGRISFAEVRGESRGEVRNVDGGDQPAPSLDSSGDPARDPSGPLIITQGGRTPNAGPPSGDSSRPSPSGGNQPDENRARPQANLDTRSPAESQPPAPVERAEADPPRVIPPAFKQYTVKKNDSAWRIAEREYGSARFWGVVARANPLKDIERLSPGDVIRLPLDPNNIQGIPAGSATPEQDRAEPAESEYRVESGDTLSEISKRVYGTVAYTDAIFRANRGKLRNKNDLRVGQVLVIPAKPEQDD